MPETPCSQPIHPLLDHLARSARGRSEAALASLGVRLRHVVVLTLLRDHGTASQQALADTLRLDPSNVVGLLNEMEDGALIARRRNPDDRRRHVVEITGEGHACLGRAEVALGEVEDAALAALDPAERGELYRLLAKATEGNVRTCIEAALVSGLDEAGRPPAHAPSGTP